jgi:hypothetical protein
MESVHWGALTLRAEHEGVWYKWKLTPSYRPRGGTAMPGGGEFKEIVGRQRVVWPQPGGQVFFKGASHPIDVVVIEAGTAVRENFVISHGEDLVYRTDISIPILVVPSGATVVKTVAMAAPASISWYDDSDGAVWAVDQVNVEVVEDEDLGTRQLFLIAHMAESGIGCDLPRIAYHITIFLQGQRFTVQRDAALAELDIP